MQLPKIEKIENFIYQQHNKVLKANYVAWVNKAYALCCQLHGQKAFHATSKSGGGDSEHSDSSPASSPPPKDTKLDVFNYSDFEDYQHFTEFYESVFTLRRGRCLYELLKKLPK